MGSAVTYYRRYTLGSLLGLQSVDDDANLASSVGNSSSNKLPKDRFDKAIKAFKSDPEGVKKELRKYVLDAPQLTILKQNKIDLK
jgi:hypothetical protein